MSTIKLLHDDNTPIVVSVARPKKNGSRPWNDYKFETHATALKFLRAKSNEGLDAYVKHAQFDGTMLDRVNTKGNAYKSPACNIDNVVGSRAFAIDIDTGTDHKDPHYATVEEALQQFVDTFQKLRARMPLPPPNLIQQTGGGVVIAWVLDEVLAIQEWDSLASILYNVLRQFGLKYDNGMKAANRGIRCCGPEFKNYNHGTPLETKVLRHTPVRIPAVNWRKALIPYKSLVVVSDNTAEKAPAVDNSEFAVPQREFEFDMMEVLDDCQVFRENALDRGAAASYNEWAYVVSMTTRHHDHDAGRRIAHVMSSGHTGYQSKLVDDKFDNFLKVSNGKFTTCSTFAASSGRAFTACANCKFKGKVNSPAGIPKVKRETAVAAMPALPDGRYYNSTRGLMLQADPNKEGAEDAIVLRGYVVDAVRLQEERDTHRAVLAYTIKTVSGTWQRGVSLEVNSLVDTRSTRKMLGGCGLMTEEVEGGRLHSAMRSWVQGLRDRNRVTTSHRGMGWASDSEFVVGTQIVTPTGVTSSPPSLARKAFMASGDPATMYNAINQIIAQEARPEAHALIATSLAAPLISLTGVSGIALNFYSTTSGFGKSTLIDIAASVWGAPAGLMVGVDDTTNAIMRRLSELRNLPAYFDELRVHDPQAYVQSILFRLSHGVEKRRLTSDAKEQAVGEWNTILTFGTNFSFAGIVSGAKSHGDAANARYLDFPMPPLPQGSQVNAMQIEQLKEDLRHHHGHIGVKYASYLVSNRTAVKNQLLTAARALLPLTSTNAQDVSGRIQAAAGACLIVGANIAKRNNWLAIDPLLVATAVHSALLGAKGERKEAQARTDYTDIIGEFLKRTEANRLITTAAGKEKVLIINHPAVMRPTSYEIDRSSGEVLIDMRVFYGFLSENAYNVADALKGLSVYPRRHMPLAKGTAYVTGARDVVVIKLAGSPWADLV